MELIDVNVRKDLEVMRKRQNFKEMVMNGSTGTFKIPNPAELIDF